MQRTESGVCLFEEQQEGWGRRMEQESKRSRDQRLDRQCELDGAGRRGDLSGQASVYMTWGPMARLLNSHVERQFMDHTIHPLKLYHSMVFRIFSMM